MKKFGILVIALVIALGSLGVGYAAWTDQITISGPVRTGSLCLSIEPGTFEEVGGCPDKNWSGWVETTNTRIRSCPPGYKFDSIFNAPEGKCPATVQIVPVYEGDIIKALEVTVFNAYPHFAADISFWLCNCGTIPLKIKAPEMVQNPFLLIMYGDNIGAQLHPEDCVEISFYVGVVQHQGYFNDQGVWIVDDPEMPLTPMNTPLSFTIEVEGIQWNEY